MRISGLLKSVYRPRAISLNEAERATIFAPATPGGKSAIQIIRISGPNCRGVWEGMVDPVRAQPGGERADKGGGRGGMHTLGSGKDGPEPRKALLRNIVDPRTGDVIDQGVVVFFPGLPMDRIPFGSGLQIPENVYTEVRFLYDDYADLVAHRYHCVAHNSLTAEDTLEFHLHGSPAVLRSTLSALASFPYARLAERGEFTRRAFEHGKLDLPQAEGIHALVEADTEFARRTALARVRGAASREFLSLRESLIDAAARVEAIIDFGEDAEIDSAQFEAAQRVSAQQRLRIAKSLAQHERVAPLLSGVRLAVLGPPNAGKSSLVNYLTGGETSIVTGIAGTTRDVVSTAVEFGGFKLVVSDTAGLRGTAGDAVEGIGIKRAVGEVQRADLSVCVWDYDSLFHEPESEHRDNEPQDGEGQQEGQRLGGRAQWVKETHRTVKTINERFNIQSLRDVNGTSKDHDHAPPSPAISINLDPFVTDLITERTIIVVNKLDSLPNLYDGEAEGYNGEAQHRPFTPAHHTALAAALKKCTGFDLEILTTSVKCDLGLDELKNALTRGVTEIAGSGTGADNSALVNSRQALHLRECEKHLKAFESYKVGDIVFAAEEMRMAIAELGKIMHGVDVEDVLGAVFSRFCVGK